jgi:4-amino-4-deoxy-L-arabinose transferase-like glycosyltransferase
MPWAIAAFSSVMGQTELAARSVSAVAMLLAALASAWYACRWFGKGAAFSAGALHMLTPWFWESGRAAEIEALHNLGVVLAIWGIIDQCVMPGTKWHRSSLLLIFLGVCSAGFSKGPAAVPVLAGLTIAVWLVKPTGGRTRWPQVASVLVVAGVVLGGLGWLIWSASHGGEVAPITQSVGEFLWSRNRVGKIALMPLTVIASALPLSILAWWAWQRRFWIDAGAMPAHAQDAARLVTLTAAFSVVLFGLAGVSNPRYLLPAAAVLSPVAGLAMVNLLSGPMLRPMSLVRRGLVMIGCTALVIGSVCYTVLSESSRRLSSGRAAGERLAQHLPDGAVVVADDQVEARPEVLWYAQREAARHGRVVRMLWTPASIYVQDERSAPWPKGVTHALIRVDERSGEEQRMKPVMGALGLQATPYEDKAGPASRPFEFRLYAKPTSLK